MLEKTVPWPAIGLCRCATVIVITLHMLINKYQYTQGGMCCPYLQIVAFLSAFFHVVMNFYMFFLILYYLILYKDDLSIHLFSCFLHITQVKVSDMRRTCKSSDIMLFLVMYLFSLSYEKDQRGTSKF